MPRAKNRLFAASTGTLALVAAAISSIATPYLASAQSIGPVPISVHVCDANPQHVGLQVTSHQHGATVNTRTVTLAGTSQWLAHLTITRGTTTLTAYTPASSEPSASWQATVDLVPGSNTLTLHATGGCPEADTTETLTLNYSPITASVNTQITTKKSPALTGTIDNPDVRVYVEIDGHTYEARNNRDGTWTLPAGRISPGLADGSYDVRVYTTPQDNQTVLAEELKKNAVTVDTTPPRGSVTTPPQSDSRTPGLSGTVDDPKATIDVTINGKTYRAHNNGDGTWTLPDNVIDQLASGTYDVTVRMTDQAGNTSEYTTQLHIKAPYETAFVLLAPNTGFLRIGSTNIPSWLIYAILCTIGLGIIALRRGIERPAR